MKSKDAKIIMRNVNRLIKTVEKLGKCKKLSAWKRRSIPTNIKLDRYDKIVVPAIARYNRWLLNEYNRRKKR